MILIHLHLLTLFATDAETDGVNGFTELERPRGADIFTIGSKTYAIVASSDGVQVIDVSDPYNIVATDAETDGVNGFTNLDAARGVDTFTIGASTYAIVTSSDAVQVIDVSDPYNIVATDAETDGVNGFTNLDAPYGVEIFNVSFSTYAIVTSQANNGVQVIDVSDPYNIVATDAETDGVNGFNLSSSRYLEIFTVGASTYAIVTSSGMIGSGAIQVIDVSDPENIVAKDAEIDGVNGFTELDGAWGVDTFTVGASTYAIVTAIHDYGVQVIDVSDPYNIVATDAETDGVNGFTELEGPQGVDIFTVGANTYAIVATLKDGIQVIDVSDPYNIVATDAETDGVNGFTNLDAAWSVDTFTIGASTYAIVTAEADNGVQIIELSTDERFVKITKLVELGEFVSLTDTTDEGKAYTQSLSESISLADNASNRANISLSETISLADATSVGKDCYSVYLRIHISSRYCK